MVIAVYIGIPYIFMFIAQLQVFPFIFWGVYGNQIQPRQATVTLCDHSACIKYILPLNNAPGPQALRLLPFSRYLLSAFGVLVCITSQQIPSIKYSCSYHSIILYRTNGTNFCELARAVQVFACVFVEFSHVFRITYKNIICAVSSHIQTKNPTFSQLDYQRWEDFSGLWSCIGIYFTYSGVLFHILFPTLFLLYILRVRGKNKPTVHPVATHRPR